MHHQLTEYRILFALVLKILLIRIASFAVFIAVVQDVQALLRGVITLVNHNNSFNIFINMKMKKGFTLLELLVVIGIMAILIALGTTSYSTAQKKARDAKRKGDLKAIQNGLEQYYSICGYVYPTPASGNVPSSITCASPSTTIMNIVPKDPKTGTDYLMSATVAGSDYRICPPEVVTGYRLESETGCTTANNSCCLSNQQ
jgi:prepilin-type N-terminal cleavage/methylation domain-containing protein